MTSSFMSDGTVQHLVVIETWGWSLDSVLSIGTHTLRYTHSHAGTQGIKVCAELQR